MFNPRPKEGMPPKKAKKPIKRTSLKYKRKRTGEGELFMDIATERPWVCFVTGETLYQLVATSFLHVLPKALNKYPKFKLFPKNIVLATNDVHFKWDKSPRSELKKDPRFDKLFDLEEELKEEYKQLYGK